MSSKPPEPVSSIVASVVTGESIVLGTVALPTVNLPSATPGRATYHFRFLELLNNPRLASPQKGIIAANNDAIAAFTQGDG